MSAHNIFDLIVGPQHPMLKEPERFVFKVEGEYVVDVEPRIGYAHRGIEKAAENRTFLQILPLVERVCGICSNSHTLCYTLALDELLDLEVPPRAQYIRTLVAELERIHSHMLCLGVMGHEMGFDSLFMYMWRDREIVMDLLELISGNRVNYAMNIPGGVRRDLNSETMDKIRKGLEILEKRNKYYKKVFSEDPTVLKRCADVGVLKESVAKSLNAVGPTARASNHKTDVRKDDPYVAYDEIDFQMIVYDTCDVYARNLVRVDEIIEAINICKQVLDKLPQGDYKVKVPPFPKPPEKEVISRVEALRGELIYYVKADGKSIKPYRVKIRTPTLLNIMPFCEMVKGNYIADIPVVLESIDPCFCCEDRLAFVDVRTGKRWVWSLEQIRYLAEKGRLERG